MIALAMALCSAVASTSSGQSGATLVEAANALGWQIPPNALSERSPLSPTPAVLKKGQERFAGQCQKCHGAEGKGDGPYRDPKHPPANLTASTIPDGIIFYKVWNGRKDLSMPAFKSVMTRDEIWEVVEFAKSLRASAPSPQ
jgi:mono/diheme cytochrome c family protein